MNNVPLDIEYFRTFDVDLIADTNPKSFNIASAVDLSIGKKNNAFLV